MYPLNTTRIGSSPRTWGTDDRVPHGDGVRRFIPTYVGNRQNCRSWNTLRSGSSPRTWGTGRITFFAHPFVGFIPTYVGNRSVRAAWSCRDERFIPTYVGNRSGITRLRIPNSVHPHVRGEQGDIGRESRCINGSSPRTWGTDTAHVFSPGHVRFIPTYVGNSAAGDTITFSPAVHPHVRGEQRRPLHSNASSSGSSPRTWGTGQSISPDVTGGRFIPTYVGNRKAVVRYRVRDTVHPHVRGEQSLSTRKRERSSGSSPRTWGTVR